MACTKFHVLKLMKIFTVILSILNMELRWKHNIFVLRLASCSYVHQDDNMIFKKSCTSYMVAHALTSLSLFATCTKGIITF